MEKTKEERANEKEFEKDVEKKVEKWATESLPKGIEILIQIIITFVIMVVVLKFVWAWVVPDLFPGAVDRNLIESDLTWGITAKFAILISVLGGAYTTLSEAFHKDKKD